MCNLHKSKLYNIEPYLLCRQDSFWVAYLLLSGKDWLLPIKYVTKLTTYMTKMNKLKLYKALISTHLIDRCLRGVSKVVTLSRLTDKIKCYPQGL
jgi:hypothetical protein